MLLWQFIKDVVDSRARNFVRVCVYLFVRVRGWVGWVGGCLFFYF